MHLSVNRSSDEADQNLDLELVLLRNKCDVLSRDFRGRIPLHYAFVKAGKHTDSTRTDPIEVCSMIVEAMGDDTDAIDETDDFG